MIGAKKSGKLGVILPKHAQIVKEKPWQVNHCPAVY
jgi:hypothetical protein